MRARSSDRSASRNRRGRGEGGDECRSRPSAALLRNDGNLHDRWMKRAACHGFCSAQVVETDGGTVRNANAEDARELKAAHVDAGGESAVILREDELLLDELHAVDAAGDGGELQIDHRLSELPAVRLCGVR